jgi:plasmid stabilization system protein ParE
MKIVISDKANSDLLRIYLYLAPRDLDAAKRAVARFDQRFAQLPAFRSSGAPGQV